MKTTLTLAALLAAAGLLLWPPAPAGAQETDKAKTDDKDKKKKGGGPILLDEIVIEGQVKKPQAFYILQRSSFGYKITELQADYAGAIVDSVKNEVF